MVKIFPIRILIAINNSKRLAIHHTSLLKTRFAFIEVNYFNLPQTLAILIKSRNKITSVMFLKNEEPFYKHLSL